MKKLFISQPMKGKSDADILAERQKAIKSAEEKIGEPVEVIDSFFQEAPVDAKPLWFLGNGRLRMKIIVLSWAERLQHSLSVLRSNI